MKESSNQEPCTQLTFSSGIYRLTISRLKQLNALNEQVLEEICAACEKVSHDPRSRVLMITGAGEKSFVAGADIQVMSELKGNEIADYMELGQRTMRAVELLRVPVIAQINGYALGGGLELALACDILLASDLAKFGLPEVNLGVFPGFGGTQRLMQRVGLGTAKRLIYTGEIIDAIQADSLGLVDQVFIFEEFENRCMSLAQNIAAKAPLAVAKAKEVMRKAQEQVVLDGLRFEVEGFLEIFDSEDRVEGMSAFLQKREPVFKGK